ncbi:MAG: glycosyltransferase family 4 protein [Acetobacteraceae bacterium]|nr:glycosyltransferase family 4 protein [Acetobacteraceae bacterium]
MTVWFDVEDVFNYVEAGHRRPSGIQRLALEIHRAADGLDQASGAVRFVRHGPGPDLFTEVTWAQLDGAFAGTPAGDEPGAVRRAARRLANRLPQDLRKPLVAAAVMQVQTVGELGRFGVNLLTPRPRRRIAPASSGPSFGDLARPGDTVLALGAHWFRPDYAAVVRWLRDERRIRFGLLIHDLVPIRRPEWSHSGVVRTFGEWLASVLPFCDLVLANSRDTAAEVEAFARERGIALPRPVRPVPVGTGFAAAREAGPPRRAVLPEPGSYVLFVSTIEPRKNHLLVVRIWMRLLAEVRAGRRRPESVPDLVFAGRVGWLADDLVQQLENAGWADGRIRLLAGLSDSELHTLYENCLFTVFPSLHEGWGLPVTESLAAGKPCLCSNAAALPEAGGTLCRYFDPEDLADAYAAVCAVLDDRPGLAEWEARIRREFRPTSWTETAAAVLQAVAEL